MYQLYFNPTKSSWSLRVWVLLKELNVPFSYLLWQELKLMLYISILVRKCLHIRKCQ